MPKLDKDCHAYILNSQRKNNKQSQAQNVQKQNANTNNQNFSNNCNPGITNSNSKANMSQNNPNNYYPPNIVPPNINQNFIPPNLQTQYPMQNGYFNGYYNGYPNAFQAQPYQPYMQFNNFNIMGPIINNYQFNNFDNSFFYPGSNEYIQQNLNLNSFFRSDTNLTNQNLLPNFNPFIAPPMSMYGKPNEKVIPTVDSIYSEVYQNINTSIKIPNPNPTPVFHKRKTSHDIDHFFELTKKKPIVDPILPNN